jgi:hypothetical protein
MCPNRLYQLSHYLSDNSERDSITTLFRRVSDVGLGYTYRYTEPAEQCCALSSRSTYLGTRDCKEILEADRGSMQ